MRTMDENAKTKDMLHPITADFLIIPPDNAETWRQQCFEILRASSRRYGLVTIT